MWFYHVEQQRKIAQYKTVGVDPESVFVRAMLKINRLVVSLPTYLFAEYYKGRFSDFDALLFAPFYFFFLYPKIEKGDGNLMGLFDG